jgi:hypothetical protein
VPMRCVFISANSGWTERVTKGLTHKSKTAFTDYMFCIYNSHPLTQGVPGHCKQPRNTLDHLMHCTCS